MRKKRHPSGHHRPEDAGDFGPGTVVDTIQGTRDSDTAVILMTGYATLDSAVSALRGGVVDYLRQAGPGGRAPREPSGAPWRRRASAPPAGGGAASQHRIRNPGTCARRRTLDPQAARQNAPGCRSASCPRSSAPNRAAKRPLSALQNRGTALKIPGCRSCSPAVLGRRFAFEKENVHVGAKPSARADALDFANQAQTETAPAAGYRARPCSIRVRPRRGRRVVHGRLRRR